MIGTTWSLNLQLAKNHNLIYPCSEYQNNMERFWFKPPGDASHSCNSNLGENVILPQFSKSEKPAESALSVPTPALKPASALFAGRVFQQSYTKQKGQTTQKEKYAADIAEQTTACYHSLFLLHPRKFLETVCGKEKNPPSTRSWVIVSRSTTEPQTQKHQSKETVWRNTPLNMGLWWDQMWLNPAESWKPPTY